MLSRDRKPAFPPRRPGHPRREGAISPPQPGPYPFPVLLEQDIMVSRRAACGGVEAARRRRDGPRLASAKQHGAPGDASWGPAIGATGPCRWSEVGSALAGGCCGLPPPCPAGGCSALVPTPHPSPAACQKEGRGGARGCPQGRRAGQAHQPSVREAHEDLWCVERCRGGWAPRQPAAGRGVGACPGGARALEKSCRCGRCSLLDAAHARMEAGREKCLARRLLVGRFGRESPPLEE